jgi:hypothetical protein
MEGGAFLLNGLARTSSFVVIERWVVVVMDPTGVSVHWALKTPLQGRLRCECDGYVDVDGSLPRRPASRKLSKAARWYPNRDERQCTHAQPANEIIWLKSRASKRPDRAAACAGVTGGAA